MSRPTAPKSDKSPKSVKKIDRSVGHTTKETDYIKTKTSSNKAKKISPDTVSSQTTTTHKKEYQTSSLHKSFDDRDHIDRNSTYIPPHIHNDTTHTHKTSHIQSHSDTHANPTKMQKNNTSL